MVGEHRLRLMGGLVGWLVGWLIGWLVGWPRFCRPFARDPQRGSRNAGKTQVPGCIGADTPRPIDTRAATTV